MHFSYKFVYVFIRMHGILYFSQHIIMVFHNQFNQIHDSSLKMSIIKFNSFMIQQISRGQKSTKISNQVYKLKSKIIMPTPCWNGPNCYYLRNRRCNFYHPPEHSRQYQRQRQLQRQRERQRQLQRQRQRQRQLQRQRQRQRQLQRQRVRQRQRQLQRQRQRQRQLQRQRQKQRQLLRKKQLIRKNLIQRSKQRKIQKQKQQMLRQLQKEQNRQLQREIQLQKRRRQKQLELFRKRKRQLQKQNQILRQRGLLKLDTSEIKKLNFQNNMRQESFQHYQKNDIFLLKQKKQAYIKNCSICIQQYGIEDKITQLNCKHHFHHQCIYRWLLNNNTCPLCKHDFKKPSQKRYRDFESCLTPNNKLQLRNNSLRKFSRMR